MPYINDLAQEWIYLLNSTVITEPVTLEIIYDPTGTVPRDLSSYLISFNSLKHTKNIYPDDRLNSWSVADITCQFNNIDGYFEYKQTESDSRWIDLLAVYGKKVQVKLVSDACVSKLDLGLFYVYQVPSLTDDGLANWTFSSREKEFSQRNLFANSNRKYNPGAIMPDPFIISTDYSAVPRTDIDGNAIAFDQTETSDGSEVDETKIVRNYFPFPVVSKSCPLGTWTIEFIDGRKDVDSDDPLYNDTTKYKLTSPDGETKTHDGLYACIDTVDTLQSITAMYQAQDGDKLLTSSEFKILSVSGDTITFTEDHDFLNPFVNEIVLFGSGSISGINLGQSYAISSSPNPKQISISGLTIADFSGDIYVRLSESNYDSSVTANFNFLTDNVNFDNARLLIPKIKDGYFFKEDDVITFQTNYIPKPSTNDGNITLGDSVFSLLTSSGYLFPDDYFAKIYDKSAGDLDTAETTSNTDIDYTSIENMNQIFGYVNVPMVFDQQITVWKAIEVICKHFNVTAYVNRAGLYSISVYRPKSREFIRALTGFAPVVKVSQSKLDYFNSVRINYDYDPVLGEYQSKYILNVDGSGHFKAKEPILDLWCPAFHSGVVGQSYLASTARHFSALWGEGLTVYDIEMIWNLSIGLQIDEIFDLIVEKPDISTRIEVFETEAQFTDGTRLVRVRAYDSGLSYGQYAFTNVDYTNSDKIVW